MPKTDFEYGSSELETFWYWINERQRIYDMRAAGQAKPWTKDEILQQYKFTHAFRQLDRGTVALTNALADAEDDLDDADIVWNVMWYRLFNVDTHINELGAITRVNAEELFEYLRETKAKGGKIFTSAHLTASGGFGDKLLVYINELKRHIKKCEEIADLCLNCGSMHTAFLRFKELFLVGKFIAYEMVCDLRFTDVLEAHDRMKWASMGPGAQRGLQRLGFPAKTEVQGTNSMRELLNMAQDNLGDHVMKYALWPFELREIEHSLCEFDKYERVRTGVGRPRQKFDGTA